MIVPPGYPYDNFPIMASSGEHVTIEKQKGGRSGGGNTYITIDARGAAHGVEDAIMHALMKAGIRAKNMSRTR